MVKEAKGKLRVLATYCILFQMIAKKGFDMIKHILKLWKLQKELHLMESLVSDEDFMMILITLLPES